MSSESGGCNSHQFDELSSLSFPRVPIRRESPSESWKELPNLSQRRPRIRTEIGGRARPKVGKGLVTKVVEKDVQMVPMPRYGRL
jgi:hypothetical protein